MTPSVAIHLDGNQREYVAGEKISGEVEVGYFGSEVELRQAEVAVLWYTEGKGDQDDGVAYLAKLWEGATQPMGSQRFSVQLPLLPLSYQGRLLKIHWAVRVRLDLRHGKDVVAEEGFTVVSEAHAPAPQEVEADTDTEFQLSQWLEKRGRK